MTDNGYDNLDEYYEDLSWEDLYDDPTEYEEDIVGYHEWLASDEDEYDRVPF